MTTGKTIALTRWTFVGKVMSLIFNIVCCCLLCIAYCCLNPKSCPTLAYQASLSMGFPRQEYWSRLPFPSPKDLPNQGSNQGLLHCRQTLCYLNYQGSPVFGMIFSSIPGLYPLWMFVKTPVLMTKVFSWLERVGYKVILDWEPLWHSYTMILENEVRDFSARSVVKSPCFHCRGRRLDH